MDEMVARSLAKWPDVPAVYGWLSLDRRGNWRIKGEKIGNTALRDFIGRNDFTVEFGPFDWSLNDLTGRSAR